MNKNILYLSYDGMTDALGQSQVLPYLKGLSKIGYQIDLISFEKEENFEKGKSTIDALCSEDNIKWTPLKYTKKPPVLSTLWDIRKLNKLVSQLSKFKTFDLIHCRSYLTSITGLKYKKKYNIPFVFDMRGFWADERVDGGLWNLKNPIFKFIFNFFKKKESQYFELADSIVSLTEIGKKEILSWKHLNISEEKFFVIPCCCDLDHFNYEKVTDKQKTDWTNKLQLDQENINLGYLGNFSTVYMFDETLEVYKKLKAKNIKLNFIIMTKEPLELLNMFLDQANLLDDPNITTISLNRNQVPEVLSLLDYSIFFCQPSFARLATSPTRMAELLACGVKIITNDKIGDTTQIVLNGEAGYVLDDFSKLSKEKLLKEIKLEKRNNPEKLRQVSLRHFSLDDGIQKYNKAYLNALR
jgi:glycosyltransferase involved in cell wall biosynthesis